VKEKFSANRGETLINQPGWLLSHTVQRSTAKNRQNRIETAPNPIMARCFCAPTSNPARSTCPCIGAAVLFSKAGARAEQNESGFRRRPVFEDLLSKTCLRRTAFEDLPSKQAKAGARRGNGGFMRTGIEKAGDMRACCRRRDRG
jgi:hypothetical protein